MDRYGTALRDLLFPAFERLRGRPTLGLMAYLARTQYASRDELHAIQSGLLRRLVRHAHAHTAHYRAVMDAAGVGPGDVHTPADLRHLPVLDRAGAVASAQTRMADAPPRVAVVKKTSGTTGEPMVIAYNAESRHFRDAARWRGYGWAGYQMGHKAAHYWAQLAKPPTNPVTRAKIWLDHAAKRDLFLDSTPRSDAHLRAAADQIARFAPDVLVCYSQAGGDLARYVLRTGGRGQRWKETPVLCGAEQLLPHDRDALGQAFGPAFETYGCREFQLVGSECEVHDGLHQSMENQIVELLVRAPGQPPRLAAPGETGEVVVTDLHNLACPMIRYVTGDLAVARAPAPCACGRTLDRIGPIQGRVTETMRDGAGNPVGGLLFSILFVSITEHARQFQAVQRADDTVVLRVVPVAAHLPDEAARIARDFVGKYLPGIRFVIEEVTDIPLTAAGKRRLVVVEPKAR
ncbi:MAG: phenylacetate--CoA ligase family protein [Kofleriaceae bacterium]|nr:phenylacetate--CoA ligase family protein [Kofleriaceae bacterium]